MRDISPYRAGVNPNSEIIQDPTLKVAALGVDGKDGVVILNGIVRSFEQKKLIGEIVQGIPG